ncbi:MAG: CBS domain-containing protein [Candidatus Cloacimonadota bacterium]|nr:CBS domain-containing protein [Candidatus Cloacimonadota bacterium]
MIISDVLKKKGNEVLSVQPNDVACAAIKIFNKKHIGALMVLQNGEIKGLVSERDVVRKIYSLDGNIKGTLVKEFMTPAEKLITSEKGEKIDVVMNKMTTHKIRHIPIIDDGKLVGIISIGDIVKAILAITTAEKEALQDYISSPY